LRKIKQQTEKGKHKMKNEKVEITTKTAWVALEFMHDYLEWIDRLDDETRRNVIALDELVRVLDAEQFLSDKWQKRQEEAARLNEAHRLATAQKEKTAKK
jgi:hypothetical protein